MKPQERQVVLDHKYLNLPVKNGAAKVNMSVTVDGELARKFEIELAQGEPDYWVFTDVSQWAGKTALITVQDPPEGFKGLEAIECRDDIKGADFYNEPLRPQFHFTTKRGWNNDPNGMVYYKGEYHLYYQHNPYGTGWGNMHWGHAVSRDMVHWKEMPVALYQYTMAKGMCFSGNGIVDENNVAGFQTGEDKALIAFFTDTGAGEAIAYSNDRGLTWTPYEGNPVIKHEGRDPFVFWYEPGKHFSMAVYDETNGQKGIAFYTSTDLKNWKREECWLPDYWECPNLLEMPLDGNADQKKWVIYGASGEYQIGTFDGKAFKPETDKIRFNYGNCYYAAQTFNNIPASDGRIIQMAWAVGAHTPGMPFSQCMTTPVSLRLHATSWGPRMWPTPVKELETLRGDKVSVQAVKLSAEHWEQIKAPGDTLDLEIECAPDNASYVSFVVRGVPIIFDAKKQTLYAQGCAGPLIIYDGKIRLRVLMDRSTMEIFGNNGELYMPLYVLSDPKENKIAVSCDPAGQAMLTRMDVYKMNSAW